MSAPTVSAVEIESLKAEIEDLQSQIEQKDLERADAEEHYRRLIHEAEEKAHFEIECAEYLHSEAMEDMKCRYEEMMECQKCTMEEDTEYTVSLLKKIHSEQLNQQSLSFNRKLEANRQKVAADATARIKELIKDMEFKIQQAYVRCQTYVQEMAQEELEMRAELGQCKEPVMERYTRDCDADSVGSGDHAPEPTNDLSTLPAGDLKETLLSMTSTIANSLESVNWEDSNLVSRLQEFLSNHFELAEDIRFQSELKKQKEREMDNEECRRMDVRFLESLI